MKLLRVSRSLVHFVTVFSMVMPSVALVSVSDDAWAGSSCQQLVDDCNKAKNDVMFGDDDGNQSACSDSNVGNVGKNNVCYGSDLQQTSADKCRQQLGPAIDKCTSKKNQCKTECKPPKTKPDQTDKCEQSIQQVVDNLTSLQANMGQVAGGAAMTGKWSCDGASPSDTQASMPDGQSVSPASNAPPAGGDDSTTKPGGSTPQGSQTPAGGQTSNTGSGAKTGGAGGGAGGGMGNMMSSLMPLAMMAAMMAAQQNKNNQQQAAQQAAVNGYASPDGVVDSSGKVNCGATYAYRYTSCNTQVSQACIANVTTMASSQVCEQFSARYCNAGYSAPSFYSQCPYPYYAGETCGTSYFTTPSPTQATQVDIVGEGIGSPYCLRASQINFCAVAANAQCPSCLQLQSLQSTACISNPSLCNVQNSAATTGTQIAACPATDPLVAAGLISGSTVVAGTPTTTPTTLPSTAPPAVLPLASASTASAGGLQVASAINGINGRSPASAGDVAPEYGVSLFNAGSTPLSQRCNAGLFNHCIRN